MPGISVVPHRLSVYFPTEEDSVDLESNLIQHKIASITSSDIEKVKLNDSCLNFNNRLITRLKNCIVSSKIKPMTPDIELEYMGRSLPQQSEDISAQLQEKLAPKVSSPFRLKGKTGLFLGAGVLAGVTVGTLSYRHYWANRAETVADISIQSMERESNNIESLPSRIHARRSINVFSESHIQHDDDNSTLFFHSDNQRQHIVHFLSKKKLLDNNTATNEIKKEILVAAVAKYLYFQNNTAIKQVTREKKVAMRILADNHLYGGKKGEIISPSFAHSVISHWLFHTVLSSSPAEYIANKIRASSYPDYFTVSSFKQLLSLNYLFQDALLNYQDIPGDQWGEFNTMWHFYLENEIPILKWSQHNFDNIPLTSQDFADLYTGSVFLNNQGHLTEYTLNEVIQIGKTLWQIAMTEGVNINQIGYFLFPASIIFANYEHEELSTKNSVFDSSISALERYIKYRKSVIALQQDLSKKFHSYKIAINNWESKGKLADNIIMYCPVAELPQYNYYAYSLASPKQKREQAKQLYLNGIIKPCQSAPVNLNDEYTKLTLKVADSFFEIDRLYSWLAFARADKHELNFIFSSGSEIKKVHLLMRIDNPVAMIHGVGLITDSWIGMKDTDLFAVSLNNNERIYALKKITDNSNVSYQLLRVDRNIRKYIDYRLLDYKHFSKKYNVKKNKIVDNNIFIFNITILNPSIINSTSSNKTVIDFLSKEHRDKFYDSLYQQGNDKSDIQKVWHYAKHLLPFYDCVEAIIDGNAVQAVPACLMDLISLIPVSGQATNMGSKFAMAFTKSIGRSSIMLSRGAIKNAGAAILREISLPKVSELAVLTKNTLRSVDPGFELVTRGGKFLTKKVDYFLRQQENGHLLAEKILSYQLKDKPELISKTYTSARLPHSDIEVPVQRIDPEKNNGIYALVNPDTGEFFGNYYKMAGNRELESIKGDVYKQQTRPQFHKMDQYEQPDLNIASNIQLSDVRSIPAQSKFLSPQFYLPPHMQWSGVPHVQLEDQIHLAEDFTHTAILIKNSVVENYNQNDVFYCRFNQRQEEIPEQFSLLRDNIQQYKEEVLWAQHCVNNLDYEFSRTTMKNNIGELQFPRKGHRIEAYLSKVLQLNTIADADIVLKIKKEAMERLRFHTEKIKNYLTYEINNIYFVTSATDAHPYIYSASCPMGFMYTRDNFRRIIIMVDNYQTAPILSTQPHYTALHEASHFSGSLDFHIAPSTSLVGDASEFMESFNDGIFGINGESIDIKDAFVEAYRREHPDINIDKYQIRELLKRDPILRANAFMENADFLAKMIADLGSGTPYNIDMLERRKRQARLPLGNMTFILCKLLLGKTKSVTLNPHT